MNAPGLARAILLALATALAVVVASPGAAAAPVREGRDRAGCPSGFTCRAFEVPACQGVSGARGSLAVALPSEPRGLVVFLSGGGGQRWFGGARADVVAWMARLRDRDRLGIVQVRWAASVWATADAATGPDAAACRSAEVLRMVHRDLYVPLARGATDGRCGFCVVGNSGGASQAAYALSRYGLDDLVDRAALAGGPPHAALAKGCLRRAGEEAYWYTASNARVIDASYGYRRAGPCARHDSSFELRWRQDSADTASVDHLHPTRLVMLYGAADHGAGPPHGRDYARSRGWVPTNDVRERVVDRTAHDMARSPRGRAEIRRVLVEA